MSNVLSRIGFVHNQSECNLCHTSSSHANPKSKTTSFKPFWVILINTPSQEPFLINPYLYHYIIFLRRYSDPSLGSPLIKICHCCSIVAIFSTSFHICVSLFNPNIVLGVMLAPRSTLSQKSLCQKKCSRIILMKRFFPAQDVHFFYTRSHLSSLQNCALLFSIYF